MGCKVIFSPQAIADLAAAVRFIAEDNPGAAVHFGNALIDRAAILENFPLLGPTYPKRPDVRKLVSRPYLIFSAFANRKILWMFCVTGMARNANRMCVRWIKFSHARILPLPRTSGLMRPASYLTHVSQTQKRFRPA